jgi:hypothetical protein
LLYHVLRDWESLPLCGPDEQPSAAINKAAYVFVIEDEEREASVNVHCPQGG